MAKKLGKSKQRRKGQKVGLPPGSLVYTGTYTDYESSIELIRYNQLDASKVSLDQHNLPDIAASPEYVFWININGLTNVDLLRAVGQQYGIHNLWLEDILNVEHIPKIEIERKLILTCIRMMRVLNGEEHFDHEQVSIFKRDNLIITFQEKEGDVFDALRNRILEGKGKVRERSSDYLLYLLMDAVTDQSFTVLENIGNKLNELENDILTEPKEYSLQEIGWLRKENINFKRYVGPLSESMFKLLIEFPEDFHKGSKVYYKDLKDHLNTLVDEAETQREAIRSLLDLYMNLMSLRMNKVMEKLTIVATIFIPLTFVAGVYGMNFTNMPELSWENGYFYALGFMAILGVGMYFIMKRKKYF